MRSFVAIELPDDVRSAWNHQAARWSWDSRHVKPCRGEHLHITLKFLGDAPPERMDEIGAVIAAAARRIEPFLLEFEGLGAFPNAHSPRVLWLGIADPTGGCARWLERADPELAKLGIAVEERPFHPHVTLARSRDQAGSAALRRALDNPPPRRRHTLLVREVTLFESRLGPQGPTYRAIGRYPLGGPVLDASPGSG